MTRIKKIDAQLAQYFMRSAFEEGFRMAGGERGKSNLNPSKGKWFTAWVDSKTRATLIANGLISGEENWR